MNRDEKSSDTAPRQETASGPGTKDINKIPIPDFNPKSSKRIILYPIVFLQVYLSASVLTFVFGPWDWPIANPWTLYSFLILAQLALLLGYWSALKKLPCPSSTKLRVPMLVTASLGLNLLWIGQTYRLRTGKSFSLGELLHSVAVGMTDPGQQYDERIKNYLLLGTGAPTTFDYLTLFLYPVLWIAFPLGVVFWNQLSIKVRVAFVGWVILDVLTWVAAGTNKGVADFVLLLPCLLVARKPAMLANLALRKLMTIGMIAVIGFAALLTFFSVGMLGRGDGNQSLMSNRAGGVSADPNSPTLRYLPPNLQEPFATFLSYFSQGYYGLSLSLEEPFVFCYGLGNSYFLEGLSRNYISAHIKEETYPARIERSGWDSHGNWHSIYPWIASDLSFPGTIVFMFFVGRVFALVWLDVAFCRNVWAVCLLPLLLIMLLYIPANNQVLGFSSHAMPFWVLLFLWYISRSRRSQIRVES